MLAFDPKELSTKNITDLAPGQLFHYISMGESRLALSLAPRSAHPIWLNLTGKLQFHLDTFERLPARMRVLPLPIPPNEYRIRADFSSVMSSEEHRLGALVFASDQKCCVAVRWGDSDEFDRHVADLDTLDFREQAGVNFRIPRWALSYLDESGQWLDILLVDVPRVDAA